MIPTIRAEDAVVVGAAQPKLMVLKEACKYGGFGKKKAYALIRAGKIDAYKMEGRVVVDRASIDRYHKSLPKVLPLEQTQ